MIEVIAERAEKSRDLAIDDRHGDAQLFSHGRGLRHGKHGGKKTVADIFFRQIGDKIGNV